ncbi:2-aminoethylphosphonate aminotransferase [Micromonospora andamanensis]|uniref:pyridoxal-phosphate-dependent aminotransferase family protein n=1 Tax=Micromonospora andamanensis TaxID=1287068 RepID=UPI00194E097F|nr:aminotransferase class V-fold PLP-dependent enzyme [Micromonospora andamanensis]GIJ38317.1 2-aminoethylphosphonate--pyruvate transaminase [Micromonospora andamanensis]
MSEGRLVLLNPGPVNVHEKVRAAIAAPDLCHREPEAADLMAAVSTKVTEVCGAGGDHRSVLLTGSGTAALEATIASVVPPNGRLLVLDNGHYGERLHRIAAAHGLPSQRLEFGWATPIDLEMVAAALLADPSITHVGLVHHETSTGMLNPLRAVGDLVAGHGRTLIVDAISSLGSEQLDMAADHIGWCIGTANKCLEGLPGISFVCAPRAGFASLADLPTRGLYLDLHTHYRAQVQAQTFAFTPALGVLHAFDVALDLMLAEGVASRGRRYAELAQLIRDGLTQRGVQLLLPPEHRANSLTNAHLANGMTYQELHDGLRRRGYVIYATQDRAAGVFRLANMGQLTEADIAGLFVAFDEVTTERR